MTCPYVRKYIYVQQRAITANNLYSVMCPVHSVWCTLQDTCLPKSASAGIHTALCSPSVWWSKAGEQFSSPQSKVRWDCLYCSHSIASPDLLDIHIVDLAPLPVWQLWCPKAKQVQRIKGLSRARSSSHTFRTATKPACSAGSAGCHALGAAYSAWQIYAGIAEQSGRQPDTRHPQ